MDATVEWSCREKPLVCHSISEIDALLDLAHAESLPNAPFLAVVTHQGYGICIGLGIDPTVVEIHYPPCGEEWYTSTGEVGIASELVDFFNRQGHYQYSRDSFVPMIEARDALREFIRTGRRSAQIRWRSCGVTWTVDEHA